MESSAFTSKYDGISNRLINDVVIVYNGSSITARALWDTGATSTSISYDIATKLCMTPIGKKDFSTPSGVLHANTYIVDIELPCSVRVSNIMVSDSEIANQGIDALIGMDIIGRGDFSVSNYGGKTLFTFRIPPQGVTDYYKRISFNNVIGAKHGNGLRKRKHK